MSDKQLPDGIQWPRFEDGELVKPGDVMYARDFATSEEIDCIFFEENGTTVKTTSGHYWWVKKNEKIKRPPVLDKDGIEIKVGDTVWDTQGTQCVVENINRYGADRPLCECTYKYEGCAARVHKNPCILTHTPPDSWEKLREDARKVHMDYWGCGDAYCVECPALIDGDTPTDHYHVTNCSGAQKLDIIHRAEKLAGVMGDE